MLSSAQISALHAQQAQAFGAQAAYTQQLSAMMPPMVGLGAQGFGGNQGGGYNYGGGWGSSYGPGNSFGNTMTSAVGGMTHAFGRVASIGGQVGGFLMGGAVGSFVGGLPGKAMMHMADSMMDGAHEQAAMERTLSQFQFQNANSRTGHGFSRGDSSQIGNMVRQMERLPEMLTSFGELNRVMDKMGQMGLMNGVRDAGEFMKKFRDNISTLKDLAKMMGSTMEGALQAFGEARMSGFYSKGDIAKNILNRQVTASVTGMSQQQIAGLQAYGGDLAHSLGGSRAGGSSNFLRTASQLGMANQMGILTNNQIVEMTGKEGQAGIEDIAGQMGQLAYRMGSSNVGQAMTLALGKMDNGRFTGEMDDALVEKVRRGELSLSELKSLARKKASTRGAKLSFSAHAGRLRTNMASAVGAEGVGMELQEILGERGWSNPDATNLVMQRFGASEEQANMLQQLMPNLQDIGTQLNSARKNEARSSAMNSAEREHGWDAIKHRISTKIGHYTTDWAKDLGVGVRDYFQNWADEFLDDLSGHYTTQVTKRVSEMARFGGLGKATAGADQLLAGLGGGRIDVGRSGGYSGALARAAHSLGGGETQGERLDYILSTHMGGKYLNHGAETIMGPSTPKGDVILDSSWTGRLSSASTKGISNLRSDISSKDYGKDQLAALKSSMSDSEFQGLVSSYKEIMSSGEAAQIADPADRERYVYSKLREKNRGNLSPMAALQERSGNAVYTALGKARQKAGLGEGDIVAALGKEAGGFRGAVNYAGMLGDYSSLSLQAVSGKLKDAASKFAKVKNDEHMASGADLKNYLDQGGDMGAAAMALFGDKKALLSSVLSKDPANWGDEEKKALRASGIDPDRMAKKLNSDPAEMDKLIKLAKSGQIDAAEVFNYVRLSDAMGTKEIANRFRAAGTDIESRLTDNVKSVLGKTKQGQKVLDLLNKRAKNLKSVNSGSDVDAYTDSGDLESALSGLTDEQKQAAYSADENLAGNAGYLSQTKKRLGRVKRGGNTQDILAAVGMGDIGFDGAAGDFRKKLDSAISGGKGKGFDSGDMEQVVKLLMSAKDKSLFSKAGTEAGSTQVSEQEIANSLQKLSDNNVKLATIMGNMAAGKSGKDLLAGTEGGGANH